MDRVVRTMAELANGLTLIFKAPSSMIRFVRGQYDAECTGTSHRSSCTIQHRDREIRAKEAGNDTNTSL
ncbi:MAG: hypothetical protein V4524_03320 [Patescibacteria group bacterium]